MKTMRRIAVLAICTIMVFLSAGHSLVYAETAEMTAEQRNAIAMLNYISVLTQEINESKASRVFLENAYSTLVQNINPEYVDSTTLSQMNSLLDTMEAYRMIDVKRDRLKYIYDQNMAQAMHNALPSPVSLLSYVSSYDLPKLLASIAYMAVDSYDSYKQYTYNLGLQYMEDGWELDDAEAQAIHNSRKNAFTYMVNIVNDYSLKGDITLSEDTVKRFVDAKNDTNNISRLQFLESNKKTYETFGDYWLVLAQSYYEDGDYQKCLDAIETYKGLGIKIFRHDFELAEVMPIAIASAQEVYSGNDYVEYADGAAQIILDNSQDSEWCLRYVAALTLAELYGKTQDESYLQRAFDTLLNSINAGLAMTQRTMNEKYLKPVEKISVPKNATKKEKSDINKYNDMLKEVREKELPPVCMPLYLECELLFAIAEEKGTTDAENKRVNGILHPRSEKLFLSEEIDGRFWLNQEKEKEASEDVFAIQYGGNGMIVPIKDLTDNTRITATVTAPDKTKTVFDDWTVDKVARDKDDDISTFEASYSSKAAEKYKWTAGCTVDVQIDPIEGSTLPAKKFKYTTAEAKDEWTDYLQFWKGYKNNWYDYAKVWENSLEFTLVQ